MTTVTDLWYEAMATRAYSSTDTETRLVLAAMLFARRRHQRVLELGGHVGGTSLFFLKTLPIYGGSLTVVENNPAAIPDLRDLLAQHNTHKVPFTVVEADALDFLATTEERYDFIYVDDNHTEDHVRQEIALLPRVCAPDALVTFHDVYPPSDYIGDLCSEAGGSTLPIGEHGLGVWRV